MLYHNRYYPDMEDMEILIQTDLAVNTSRDFLLCPLFINLLIRKEMKEDLMFGSLGNGITVADRNQEEHNDYKTVAHIAYNRDITYYDKKMTPEAMKSIEYYAKYGNSSVSATQLYPVLKPAEFSKIDVQELKEILIHILKLQFEEVNIEVASCPDMGYILVFTNQEACEFLSEYYRYMKTEVKIIGYLLCTI